MLLDIACWSDVGTQYVVCSDLRVSRRAFSGSSAAQSGRCTHAWKIAQVTSGGVNLAQCIKTGIDNPGHPMIKTVGLTAGDEESYTVFAELFDPVISDRHNGYGVDGTQPTDMDISKISDVDIDPFNKYVLTTRVRTGRSVRGFKLPPVISFEERRKLEAVSVKALLNMKEDLKGDYFPLHGSRSYAPKPNGMSEADEESLRSAGNLFQEPDSTLLLASGMGRHWPDGRGIFCNDNRNLFVWVGEEDHLRIVSMQGTRSKPTEEGKKIKDVFARFIRACDQVQVVLKEEGYDFMHSEHLGWILTCPSNLGTGLRAGTMVMLPLVSSRSDFKALLKKMGLQARGTGGVDSASTGGTWDISNADRIGKGEVRWVSAGFVLVIRMSALRVCICACEDEAQSPAQTWSVLELKCFRPLHLVRFQ